MPSSGDQSPAPEERLQQVKRELQRLRQGSALANPNAVLNLSEWLRQELRPGHDDASDQVIEVMGLVDTITGAINALDRHQRHYARVDFNLDAEHSYPTLTERQESLARHLKCAGKTVRRHADTALDTVALLLLAEGPPTVPAAPRDAGQSNGPHSVASNTETGSPSWREHLAAFWKLDSHSHVDIVCSEIPEDERPSFASPQDRNYLRYAKFADLDSLIYVRTRLTQALPSVTIRDFSPSEYYDAHADTLIVIGGPPWNAKFREFQPQLPFHFEPHSLGEDDPLVLPLLGGRRLGPAWTANLELLSDVAVVTRLSFQQGTTAFLLGGCLTLGVLGGAKCFLQGERRAGNAAYITDRVGDRDFVLVTEALRLGGITDVPDLPTAEPLVLLARGRDGTFETVIDNSDRRPAHD